jgi:Na+/proline symporter
MLVVSSINFLISTSIFACMLITIFVIAKRSNRFQTIVSNGTETIPLLHIIASLSATSNTAFVVFGAVGMGYTTGLQGFLLPLGFLLGDVVFWRFLPQKISAYGIATNSKTLQELVTYQLNGRIASVIKLVVTTITLLGLFLYTVAQFLAGHYWLTASYHINNGWFTVSLFGLLIGLYTAFGGFKGSIATDVFLTGVRLVGTVTAVITVCWTLVQHPQACHQIKVPVEGFLSLIPKDSWSGMLLILAFILGSLGFSLSQPQLLSRYLITNNIKQTQSTWPLYFGFVYTSWGLMVLFGILLRCVTSNPTFLNGEILYLPKPEMALPVFFNKFYPGWLNGIIISHIFASIACATNSMLVSMAQCISNDLLIDLLRVKKTPSFLVITIAIGVVCVLATGGMLALSNSPNALGNAIRTIGVSTIVLAAVYLMAGSLASVVLIRVLNWYYSGKILLLILSTGCISAGLSIVYFIVYNIGKSSKSSIDLVYGAVIGMVMSLIFYKLLTVTSKHRKGAIVSL